MTADVLIQKDPLSVSVPLDGRENSVILVGSLTATIEDLGPVVEN